MLSTYLTSRLFSAVILYPALHCTATFVPPLLLSTRASIESSVQPGLDQTKILELASNQSPPDQKQQTVRLPVVQSFNPPRTGRGIILDSTHLAPSGTCYDRLSSSGPVKTQGFKLDWTPGNTCSNRHTEIHPTQTLSFLTRISAHTRRHFSHFHSILILIWSVLSWSL